MKKEFWFSLIGILLATFFGTCGIKIAFQAYAYVMTGTVIIATFVLTQKKPLLADMLSYYDLLLLCYTGVFWMTSAFKMISSNFDYGKAFFFPALPVSIVIVGLCVIAMLIKIRVRIKQIEKGVA